MPSYQHWMDSTVHHAGNMAAITFPLMSMLLHGPEILTAILSIFGIAWYVALFIDRHKRIKAERKKPDA